MKTFKFHLGFETITVELNDKSVRELIDEFSRVEWFTINSPNMNISISTRNTLYIEEVK